MDKITEALFSSIAKSVYKSIPTGNWVTAIYQFLAIRKMNQQSGFVVGPSGEKTNSFVAEKTTGDDFQKLRIQMAMSNEKKHAWYQANLTIKNNGKFSFDFDYDHLPAFDYLPSAARWLDEFSIYSRPELQEIVQDWIDEKENFETKHDEVVNRLKNLVK